MGFPQSSRAFASTTKPEAFAICDRCGFRYNHPRLRWQFDWRGAALANLYLLVCQRCEDKPYEFNRPIIIGPDPVPIRDPRPGWYAQQEGPQPPPFSSIIGSQSIWDGGSSTWDGGSAIWDYEIIGE